MSPLAVTAWSAVNALGRNTEDVLAELDAERSGLRPPPFEVPVDTVVGAVPGELPALPRELASYDCRLARIAMMALDDVHEAALAAVARWGSSRVAILLGTSTGGLHATEGAFFDWRAKGEPTPSFDFFRQHDFNALGDLVAQRIGADGPVYTLSTACSSSGKVMATAQRLIAAGIVDAALVGGVDSLCRMTLQGFFGLGVLSTTPCRPFGEGRQGINIGEGAAFQLLEREGATDIFLLGAGESSDAHHMSSPHPEGRGAQEAMRRAIEQAGVTVDDVDHLNAHGTATPLNDAAEAIATHALFGRRIPVTSTKGFTGHLLGAAAATEATFAIHAILEGRMPPTLGCDPQDPALQVSVVKETTPARLERVLSNSFAFGGSNVSLLFGRRP